VPAKLQHFQQFHPRHTICIVSTTQACLYARERVQTTNYGKAIMTKLNRLILMAGVAALLALSGSKVLAQGRGNFDPEQMRQRMLERYKERLEVKSDDEWKIISERIEKVMTAQRDARMGGFGGGRRGGPGGGDNATADSNNNGGRRNRGGFGGEPSPEAEALQKAIDDKASSDDLKAKLAKVRDSQKEKEAKLAKAQDELRKVLSVRQEANAVLMGLLK
jgi:hypothetical protein